VLVRHGAGFIADVSLFARTRRFDAYHASLKQSVAAHELQMFSRFHVSCCTTTADLRWIGLMNKWIHIQTDGGVKWS